MPPAPPLPAQSRAQAAQAVAAVLRGRSLDDALPATADPFCRALTYGVLRHLRRLDALLAPALERPLKADSPLKALLLGGVYQLLDMDVADHAALNETVNACELIAQPRARGLVNALLRRLQRERDAGTLAVPAHPAEQHSFPVWLHHQLKTDWGDATNAVLEASNIQAPMSLRVNLRRGTTATYRERLAASGLESQPLPELDSGLRLTTPVPVDQLPGFAEGDVSVQDASAQYAAMLLDAAEGQRVLDACSAPGGKTCHLLERANLQLTALDSDPARLAKVRQSLDRLGLDAQLLLTDAADLRRWWDDKPYDRILLDAPCSGTGVIRRHPDIKWLRRETDLQPLIQVQQRLLQRLWTVLAPGGRLLYATCSVLDAEGDAVVRDFLTRTPGAKRLRFTLPQGAATSVGWRIAPGGDHDGFYYALLQKAAKPASPWKRQLA